MMYYIMYGSMQAVCANLGHTVPESIRDAISVELERLPFVYSGLAVTEARARLCNLLSMVLHDICFLPVVKLSLYIS